MGFATACLPVGKHSAIVALENCMHRRFQKQHQQQLLLAERLSLDNLTCIYNGLHILKDVFLCAALAMNMVKSEVVAGVRAGEADSVC